MNEIKLAIECDNDDNSPCAAYVYLPSHLRTSGCVRKTIPVGHGVLLDLDENGILIGVEILL